MNLKTGYIYEITSKNDGKKYFGSTFNQVDKRIKQHISSYHSYLKGTTKVFFTTSFDIIKGDFDVSILETIQNADAKYLHERERYYIENNDCVNKIIPNRNKLEYYEDNSEHLKDKMNNHYQNDINNYRTNKLLRYRLKKEKEYDEYLQKLIINELK